MNTREAKLRRYVWGGHCIKAIPQFGIFCLAMSFDLHVLISLVVAVVAVKIQPAIALAFLPWGVHRDLGWSYWLLIPVTLAAYFLMSWWVYKMKMILGVYDERIQDFQERRNRRR